MSGVVILLELLGAYAPLIAKVPAENMLGDALPIGAAIPGIGVTLIDGMDRKVLKRGLVNRVNDRVQVTLITNDVSDRLDTMPLIKFAAAGKVGDFGGCTAVSVQSDGRGPDFTTDAGLRGGSIDFLVSYNETAI